MDAEFSSLVRRASSTDHPEDFLALLRAKLRRGLVSWRQVEVAAALGHEMARRVVGAGAESGSWENGLALLTDARLRHLACDYVERAFSVFEVGGPDELRARAVVEVSRRFANGDATHIELHVAQREALAAALRGGQAGSREVFCAVALTAAPAAARGHMPITVVCVANGVLRAIRAQVWEPKPPYEARDAVADAERCWQAKRLAMSLLS
jgi:hypothetical protein